MPYGLSNSPFVFQGFMNELEKCEFNHDTIQFLGYIIDHQGIHVDQRKIQAIRDWP